MTFSYANATFGHFVFTKLCQVRLLTDETGDLRVVWTVHGEVSFLLTLFAKPFRTFADVVIFAANVANLFRNFAFGLLVVTIFCEVRLLTDETGDLGVVWTVNGKMSFLLTLFAKPFRTFADVVIFAANFASLFWLMACGNPCWGLVAKRGQHSLDLFFFAWDLLVLRLHFFVVIGDITVVNIIRVV